MGEKDLLYYTPLYVRKDREVGVLRLLFVGMLACPLSKQNINGTAVSNYLSSANIVWCFEKCPQSSPFHSNDFRRVRFGSPDPPDTLSSRSRSFFPFKNGNYVIAQLQKG